MAHPPRIPVQLAWDKQVTYLITFNVFARQPVLANEPAFAALKRAVTKITHWTILAGVMMPDHIHLLASPHDRNASVGSVAGLMKRWIRQEAAHRWQWQKGSFDRLLRTDESATAKWAYLRDNPVRAGLVERWEDWPYRIGIDL